MIGIILCGGQDPHIGSDNGLLVHEVKTWAQTAFDKLDSVRIPIQLTTV